MEIERKYLLKSLPSPAVLGEGEAMCQAYMSADEPEIRVRSKGRRSFLTIKRGSGLVRDEFELEIPPDVFERLLQVAVGNRIEKTRYRLDHAGLTWEIDEYRGSLAGLCVAEVELQSESQSFEIPDVLDVTADITEDERYKNRNLALRGAPPRA